MLVAKYADHLPLYRQAQIYARQGVRLDRSTLADWVGRAAFHLRPVHERILRISSPRRSCSPTRRPRRCSIRARADQDRPALGLCAGRSAVGRIGPAGGRLCLRARPQGLAADRASRGLQGRAPGRRLRRLSRARREGRREPRLLLGPPAPPLLRALRLRGFADRGRGAATHRRALSDRDRYPRPPAGRTARRPPRTIAPASRTNSSRGCARGSRSSVRRASSPRSFATRCRTGAASHVSSTMAGSRSTPIPSSGRSARSPSIARTPSSPDQMAAGRTGP